MMANISRSEKLFLSFPIYFGLAMPSFTLKIFEVSSRKHKKMHHSRRTGKAACGGIPKGGLGLAARPSGAISTHEIGKLLGFPL
jgi:hypothetical protein